MDRDINWTNKECVSKMLHREGGKVFQSPVLRFENKHCILMCDWKRRVRRIFWWHYDLHTTFRKFFTALWSWKVRIFTEFPAYFSDFGSGEKAWSFPNMHMLCFFASSCFNGCAVHMNWISFNSWDLDASNDVHSIPMRLLKKIFWCSKDGTLTFFGVCFHSVFCWEMAYFTKRY